MREVLTFLQNRNRWNEEEIKFDCRDEWKSESLTRKEKVELTKTETLKMKKSISKSLKFTMETEEDFSNV